MNRQEEIKNTAKKFADALSDGLYYSGPQYKCREHGFIQGAQWADKTMIEKACRWLKNNMVYYNTLWQGGWNGDSYDNNTADDLIRDFKQAMEE